MKIKVLAVLAILALVALVVPGASYAQAYGLAFTTSITYQNVGSDTAEQIVAFFYDSPDQTIPIQIDRPDLAANASTSLYLGSLTQISGSFRGSAVIQSDQPLLATQVQLPQGVTTVKNRPLSNGFAGGASQALVATVLRNTYNSNTIFSIQNAGNDDTTLSIKFYNTSAQKVYETSEAVKPGAAYYFDAGQETGLGASFNGSAVIQSDQPLLATQVQLPQGVTTVKNRPLSNGFAGGASQALVATVLRNTFNSNTIFSIQNAGNDLTTLSIKFYNTSAQKVYETSEAVEPGAAYYFDAGQETGLGASFNGSAVITASPPETSKIVGGAMELSTNTGGTAASAFETVASGAKKFFMPSAICDKWGQNTAFAIQNTDATDSTSVTVTYSNGATETKTIGPRAKSSFVACSATGMSAGFTGSAIVESTTTDIIAIGKAYGSGLSTAFVGVSTGVSKLAAPYVRWAKDADYNAGNGQRTFITIQNTGTSNLAAGAVTVKYVKYDGTVEGTHSLPEIPAGGKVNSNASLAGLDSFGQYGSVYGGGAIIEGPAGSELAVVARVSTTMPPSSFASEDYNGMAVAIP